VTKVVSEGTRLRNVSPLTMTLAQREIIARIAMPPEGERLELEAIDEKPGKERYGMATIRTEICVTVILPSRYRQNTLHAVEAKLREKKPKYQK